MTPDSAMPQEGKIVALPLPEAPETARVPIAHEELEAVLQRHVQWLESDGGEGARAVLRHADLQSASLAGARLEKADLQESDLSGADLQLAKLQGADLRYVRLRGANLRAAQLQGANLRRADVRDANLRRAKLQGADLSKIEGLREAALRDSDLSGATGLLGTEFAGLDMTGATLPKDIAEFAGLGHVGEISKHARGLFLAMIGGCVFSWLTVATTTDLALVTDTVSTPLPIIQTKVPIAGFYLAAPIILLAVYLYLNLYLQKLWQGLASLPAIFPDGRTLDQRAYPWLVNSLVRAHVPRLRAGRPPFSHLDVAVSVVMTWWLVPFTLLQFWLRYLPRHDLPVSLLQLVIVAFSAAAAIVFYRKTKATLRQEVLYSVSLRERLSASDTYAGGLLVVSLLAFAYAVCDAAIGGQPRRQMVEQERPVGLEDWVPTAVFAVGYRTFADLTEMEVSGRPADWDSSDAALEVALNRVVGANLRERDLRYLAARGAFLAKADLRGADLRSAILTKASLQAANLVLADLRGTNLLSADLRGANLLRANLQRVDLRRAELDGANLQRAILRGAVLTGADLGGANLARANLQDADLRRTNLSGTNLRGVKGLTPKQLDGACGDKRSRLPRNLSVPLCKREAE